MALSPYDPTVSVAAYAAWRVHMREVTSAVRAAAFQTYRERPSLKGFIEDAAGAILLSADFLLCQCAEDLAALHDHMAFCDHPDALDGRHLWTIQGGKCGRCGVYR